MARAYEAKLVAALSDREAHPLDHLLGTLESAANGIAREGFGMTVGLDVKAPAKRR